MFNDVDVDVSLKQLKECFGNFLNNVNSNINIRDIENYCLLIAYEAVRLKCPLSSITFGEESFLNFFAKNAFSQSIATEEESVNEVGDNLEEFYKIICNVLGCENNEYINNFFSEIIVAALGEVEGNFAEHSNFFYILILNTCEAICKTKIEIEIDQAVFLDCVNILNADHNPDSHRNFVEIFCKKFRITHNPNTSIPSSAGISSTDGFPVVQVLGGEKYNILNN